MRREGEGDFLASFSNGYSKKKPLENQEKERDKRSKGKRVANRVASP